MNEVLDNLCLKYGFRYDIIGQYARIFSSRDTWYFVNREYKLYENIKLLHSNNYYGAGTHKQKGEFKIIDDIFKYISKHDKKELLRYDKVCRISEKLKMLCAK